MNKYCCNDLKNYCINNDIDDLFCIYGKPDFYDDGDGYMDDMTEELIINFCPFCGKNLKELQ